MDEKKLYEENSTLPPFWSWVLLIVFSAMILGFAFLLHHHVRDLPREWDFGQRPQTPAESIYSTMEPPAGGPIPRQLPKLPEAKPLPAAAAAKAARPAMPLRGEGGGR